MRKAERGDIPVLVSLCKKHHEAKGFGWTFDPALLSTKLASAIASDDWLVLIGDGAVFIAVCFECPLGSGVLARELLVRGDLSKIVPIYEAWARSKGAREASLGCTEKPEVFSRLYARHGYARAETIFTKRL